MKILLYTDLAVRPDELFWHRDLGLCTKALRDLGHEAHLVVHPAKPRPVRSEIRSAATPPPVTPVEPVLWASPSDVRNSRWWREHKPDLVILGLWTRPKYDPVRRAALSATPHLIERADSDGMRTASCGWRVYACRRYDYFRDRTVGWARPISCLASGLYAALSTLACPWMEAHLAKSLRWIPDLAVETPGAAELWRSLALRLGAATRIHHIPHPVQTEIFQGPKFQKQNKVVAVGRWQSHQKNLPLLLGTMRTFLDRHPDWSGLVVGSGLHPVSPHPRLQWVPRLTPTALAEEMKAARIFLFSSRYESFLLAGAEALVAGCSVVGPEALVATQQLVEIQGCAPTTSHTLPESLEAEQQAWAEGRRDPSKISQRASAEFSSHAVAQRFISLAGSFQ